MTGEEHLKRAREPMTTPNDELAGIGPFTEGEEQAVRDLLEWPGPNWSDAKSLVLLGYLKGALATLDAARSTPVPASNVSEGLREADYRALLQPLIDRMNWTRAAREDPKVSARVFAANTTAFPWEHYERDIRGLLDAFARCEGETK